LRDYSALALRCYVQFLYSSSIEWTSEETSDLLKLATAYGPVELISLCQPQQTFTSTDAANLGNSANRHSNSNDCSGQNQAVMKADKCEADTDECLSSKTFEVKNIPKEDAECLNIHGEDANSVTNSNKAEVSDSEIDASSSSKKIAEAEASSAHKDPNDSDDVFEFLPSDDDDDNKNLKADSSPKHLVNNQIKEAVSSQKLSSSNSNEEIPRRSDSNSHVSEVIRNTESADSNQNIEEDFSKMAANESLNRSLVYSPLPLPHDSFDDAIRLSPQLEIPSSHSNHQTKHQQCTEEFSKNQKDLKIGFGSDQPFSNALSPVIETRKDSIPTKNAVQYCSTPNQPTSTSRLAQRLKELGSNVKILKTSNITPLPEYANMTDKQLKAFVLVKNSLLLYVQDELAKYGLRPMGKKRAIALLKKIYDELHPVIDLSSPVSSKPKRSIVAKKLLDRLNEVQEKRTDEREEDEANERDEDLAEKTLNRSLNEEDILEESCIDDVYNEDAPLPKDLDGMQIAVLNWLRRNDNEDLYNEVLGLNTVSFEDFYGRLSKCDTAVAKIPRKALMEILDRLHITFSLPADGWKKRRERKQKLK
uniref:Structure-specific endonuclease subunit SLX4 (inferred by orthology to a human protein) n=1 Tax=Anisakis simplex TaxID=6269 RepID=A0A0M3KCW3_ANISI